MKVSELFAEIGFKVDTRGLSDFENSMKAIQNTIKSCVDGLKEFTRVAGQIQKAAQAIKSSYVPSERDMAARFRAETYYMRSLGKEARGKAQYDKGRGLYWEERSGWISAAEARLQEKLELQKEQFEYQKEKDQNKGRGIFTLFGKNIGKGILGFSAAVLGFQAAVKTFEKIGNAIADSIKRAYLYKDFSYSTGISSSRISGIQSMIERSGTRMSGAQIANDIAALQQSLIDIKLGLGNVFPYKMLGIDAYGKNPLKVIEDLKKAIVHLDNSIAKNLLSQMGLRGEDWIRYLRGELKGGVYGSATKLQPGESEDVSELGISWKAFKTSMSDLKDTFVVALSPLKSILDVLTLLVDTVNVLLKPIVNTANLIYGAAIGVIEGLGLATTYHSTNVINKLAKMGEIASDFSDALYYQLTGGSPIQFEQTIKVNSTKEANEITKGTLESLSKTNSVSGLTLDNTYNAPGLVPV